MAASPVGAALLRVARRAIAAALGMAPIVHDADGPDDLDQLGSTFVTLTLDGRLRGCIGSLSFDRPLAEDVAANAVAAALRDGRFPPVVAAEVARLRIEVSLLSAPRPLPASATLAEAATRLRRGLDGVVLERGWARGVFLPQVWEGMADETEFLRQLRRKAGLPAEGWDPDTRLWSFAVEKFREEGGGILPSGN